MIFLLTLTKKRSTIKKDRGFMNIKTIKSVLPKLLKHRVVPFLWGNAGIGKTQSVKQYAQENGLGFVHLHAATQDVGDLVGLLIKNDDGTVKHARPKWMPTEGNGIIFLDELNRANPEVLQALFSFITEGAIHTHKLPDGWRIVAAGNYQSNQFNVTDTSDAAWMSRFCHIDVKPTLEEFLSFAESRGVFEAAGFLRENPSCLESEDKEGLDTSFIKPDRRSWVDMVGRLDENEDLGDAAFEVYSGIVGVSAAASFVAYKKKKEKSISVSAILNAYPEYRTRIMEQSEMNTKEARFDLLNQPISELLEKLESTPHLLTDENKLQNLKAFMLDVPVEMAMKAFNSMAKLNFANKNAILNDPAYVAQFKNK